jgi:hypothetical protein
LRDRVLVLGVDGEPRVLGGSAGVVWLELEVPGNATELVRRLTAVVPAGAGVEVGAGVEDALAVLSEAELIRPVPSSLDQVGPRRLAPSPRWGVREG